MGTGGTYTVGPGIWGFIAFFVLAVALWFLLRNMNGRLRRMAYRDRDETEQVPTDEPGTPDRPSVDRRADGGAGEGSGDAAPRP